MPELEATTLRPRIFISYSSKDRSSAEKLHEHLEKECDVWRDRTRLETDWSREIAEALVKADGLCLLWSSNAVESHWVKHEWLTARALEKRIFPYLLERAPDLPLPLRSLDADREAEPDKLVKRIVSSESFYHRYEYSILPEKAYIPFNPNPEFKDRHGDLLELYMNMVGNLGKTGVNQVGAVGMGGIGKTQLVVEFAYRFSFAFDGIFWIQAADEGKWMEQFLGLARDRLKLKIEEPDAPGAWRRYLLEFQTYCHKTRETLIIMDNVPAPNRLNSDRMLGMAPLALGANLLFTTRRRFDLPGVVEQPVDILPPGAAFSLLSAAHPASSPAEEDAVRQICDAVGRLPLALVLIAAFHKRRPTTYCDHLAALRKQGLAAIDLGKITDEELATRHRAAVGETISEQWKLVEDENARRLFTLAGLFPEGAIVPKASLGLLAGLEEKGELVEPMIEAFVVLSELQLIEELKGATSVRLHPLVRDFALGLTRERDRPSVKAEAARRLTDKLTEPACLSRQFQKRGVDAVADDLALSVQWDAGLREAWELYRVIDRERQNLQGGGSPFQQLHHRAFNMGLSELAERFAEAGLAEAKPFFRSVTVSTKEDPAWIRSFKGHSWFVTSVCFSPDGRRALSGSRDKTLILWDIDSGRPVLTPFTGHSEEVSSVCFSQDGRRALSGSEDKTLMLWDVESGQPIGHAFRGHSGQVTSVCFSPDGRCALSGSWDKTLILWDVQSGQRILPPFQGHSAPVASVCFSPDGRRALSGSWDKTLILWDVNSGGAILPPFNGHSSRVTGVSFSPDGRRALSCSFDESLVLWDVDSGKSILPPFQGHSDWVTSVCFSPDGRRALSGSRDNNLILWEVDSGRAILPPFNGHSDWVTSVCFSPDGRRALSGSQDRSMVLWDVDSNRPAPPPFQGHTRLVETVCFSPNNDLALSGSRDQSLILWDVDSGHPVLPPLRGHSGTVGGTCFSPDGSSALSGSDDTTLILWDLDSGEPILPALEGHSDPVTSVCFTPDGSRALSSSVDGTLILWDVESRQPILPRFQGRSGSLESVCVTTDGLHALCGSEDATLILWDIKSGFELQRFRGHSRWVYSVRLSPDGRRALSGSWDTTVILWDIDSARAIRTFQGHSMGVRGVCFSPDGRRALSGSEDATLILWQVDSGQAILRLAMKSGVRCLAWKDRRILVGDSTGITYFFEINE